MVCGDLLLGLRPHKAPPKPSKAQIVAKYFVILTSLVLKLRTLDEVVRMKKTAFRPVRLATGERQRILAHASCTP